MHVLCEPMIFIKGRNLRRNVNYIVFFTIMKRKKKQVASLKDHRYVEKEYKLWSLCSPISVMR